ncbi:MAG: hypothetical protein AAFN74_00835 [Myxococcota bacterium]
MGANTHRHRTGLILIGLFCGHALACGEQDGLTITPTADAGPPMDATVEFLREDFNNEDWLVETSSVIHDTNLGVLTLPIESIPNVFSTGRAIYSSPDDTDGLIEASSITVEPPADLRAVDAMQLRAQDFVLIQGSITAGNGGITIVAGNRIEIEGQLDSRGPIRLQVANPDGEIIIGGSVVTRAVFQGGEAPPIIIQARSRVTLEGELITTADNGYIGGDIAVTVYGDVVIDGGVITTITEPDGEPGAIILRSDQLVQLERGHIGVDGSILPRLGGSVRIEAKRVEVGTAGLIRGGADANQGGNVGIQAAETVTLDDGARIESGSGEISGELRIQAASLTIGQSAVLQTGTALSTAGDLRVDIAENMTVRSNALIAGADTDCGAGGSVQLAVAGRLSVASGAVVRGGGNPPPTPDSDCTEQFEGGRIEVTTGEADGVESSIEAGQGVPTGTVSLSLNRVFEVPVPDVSGGLVGYVRSRVIDRSSDGLGFAPMLTQLILRDPPPTVNRPITTSVSVSLRGSAVPEGPFERWIDLSDLEATDDLRDLR